VIRINVPCGSDSIAASLQVANSITGAEVPGRASDGGPTFFILFVRWPVAVGGAFVVGPVVDVRVPLVGVPGHSPDRCV